MSLVDIRRMRGGSSHVTERIKHLWWLNSFVWVFANLIWGWTDVDMLDEMVWWRTDYALAVLSSWQGSCARAVIAEVCARMLVHMCVFTYVHGFVRVCVCLNACLSVCMHAYVCMHSVCVLVYMHKSAWVWVRCVLHGFLCNMLEYKCACMQYYLYLEFVHACIECWFVV